MSGLNGLLLVGTASLSPTTKQLSTYSRQWKIEIIVLIGHSVMGGRRISQREEVNQKWRVPKYYLTNFFLKTM